MKRYATLLFLAAFASCIAARALSVEVAAPGALRDAVADPAAVTQLTVSGPVDASDFAFMADEMTALTALDLRAATVAAYDGEPLQGTRSFPANTLPQLILAGTQLSSLQFPASLEAIGECALAGTRLQSVVVPAGVRTVGAGAFSGCAELTTVRVAAATLGEGAFSGCTALVSAELPEGVAIPAGCFAGDAALAAVSAPALASVGDKAFAGCTSLSDFDFGSDITAIGAHAFAGSALETASLAACPRLATIGAGAFAGCRRLVSLTLPEGADIADAHALAMGCPRLAEATLPAGAVPDYALAGAESVDAGRAIAAATEVGDYALKGASSTAEMTLPATLEYLGDHAMEGMKGLQTIYASELTAVPELGEEVWSGVDQPSVRLIPSESMAPAFLAADQWKDFDVRSATTTGSVQQELTGKLRACFSGYVLLVECGLPGVTGITVADIDGRVLAVLVPDADGRAALDTSRWTSRVYILSASGVDASLKLARNF